MCAVSADIQGVELGDAEQQLEVQSLVLARLLGSVGDIAQRQLVHLEVTISKELKRRRLEQEDTSPRKKASHKKVCRLYYVLAMYCVTITATFRGHCYGGGNVVDWSLSR